MIVLVARAAGESPGIATEEVIKPLGETLSREMAQLAEDVLEKMVAITGREPMRVTVIVEWVAEAPSLDSSFPGGKVPPHMS